MRKGYKNCDFSCNSTGDDDFKEGRFRLDIRMKFFVIRVVRHWFVREVINVPFLEVVQGQVGHGSEQLELLDNVPERSRWDGLNDL